jgi:hypothetical protein
MAYELDELNLINETCGSVMADKIAKFINNMKLNYDNNYLEAKPNDLKRSNVCLNLLRTADYDKFYSIYVGMPTDYDDYLNDELDDKLINDELINNNIFIKHCYLEYTLAILSDPSLINKCLEISKVPLQKAMSAINQHYKIFIYEIPENFGIESYTLLRHNGFNIVNLFHIAKCKYDYVAIKFIINAMTELDLDYALRNNYYGHNIIDILLIDRCKQINTPYILSVLQQHTIGTSISSMYYISIAYYVINIMGYEDGVKYIKELNIHKSHKPLDVMLAHHFRPRGTHTKGAITF